MERHRFPPDAGNASGRCEQEGKEGGVNKRARGQYLQSGRCPAGDPTGAERRAQCIRVLDDRTHGKDEPYFTICMSG